MNLKSFLIIFLYNIIMSVLCVAYIIYRERKAFKAGFYAGWVGRAKHILRDAVDRYEVNLNDVRYSELKAFLESDKLVNKSKK